ncbi:autotransporter adhesin BpaC-like [Siniperca chuatsi]|uniref:autotransporter adhesin BpaC-like n=1 Tax=Siniperca chuatsi TaxID=119488 RepID=UPI001CE0E27E|nr:autotransporter adhesin BpaC-like [Siniperca chuatsi]
MDNRLILTVLFVTLSWIYVGTYAQNNMMNATNPENNMTTAGGSNATAAGSNATAAGNNATAAGSNATAAGNNATAAGSNATAAGNNATAAGSNATAAGNNATAAGSNATAAGSNATAAGSNATAAGSNATAAGSNATAAGNNATAAGNNATAAPPLTPNTTVEALQTPLSRAECGTKQLCAAAPSNCDPSSGSCFFLAAKQLSGQNFEFGLSGQSQGYIAATLSPDSTLGGNDTTYVCANNNGVVKFFSTVLNNGKLIKRVLNVNSVKGKVNGNVIQCTFAATVPTPATRASTLSLAISTGAFNSSSEDLGDPITQLRSPPVDLGNPNTTVTNEINPNTSAPNVTTATNNTAVGNNTTAAPPLTPNTTVEALQTPLSRAECGTKQLCAAEPSNCNPSSGSCFFLAARQLSGQNFEFGLSGQSQGYIAATLSPDSTLGGNDTTYVCANNNGVVKFFSTVLNNGKLIKRVLNVNSVKGRVNGTTIQCTFAATVPTPATRTTNLVLAISTGAFNSTSEDLGEPFTRLRSPLIDLANPNTTVTNEITTPNHAIALQQSLTQALLITVGVLGLAML